MTRGAAAGVLISALLAAACATTRDTAALRQQSDAEAAAILSRVPVYADSALAARLAGIVGRLAPDAGVSVAILRDPALAAFALPDGRVFVTTGVVAAVDDEAQLAAILAREIAHVVLRHAPGAAPATPLADVDLTPTARAILGRRLALSGGAAITGYHAGDDREADAAALASLARAGYDPRRAPLAFARLAADAGLRGPSEIFRMGDAAWLALRRESLERLADTSGAAPAVSAAAGWPRLLAPLVRDDAAEDMRLGRFALARRQLERVFETAPDDALAYVYAGDLHRLQAQRARSQGEREAETRSAQTAYELAIVQAPALADPHRQLGLLHYALGDHARARAEFEQYLALAPGAADAARVREYAQDLAR